MRAIILKLVMDAIFGEKNFRNEIVWHYRRWTNGDNDIFNGMHDIAPAFTIHKRMIIPLIGRQL